MESDKILFLANAFYKAADIKGNMAKRIMFSLLSHLAPQTQVHSTKGMVDFTALKQMIPAAKELIQFGIQACYQEVNYQLPEIMLKKLKQSMEAGDNQSTLKMLIQILKNDPNKERGGIGGDPWVKVAEILLETQSKLDQYQDAKKNNDYQAQVESLMEMTSYLNVLDGLVHNSGLLMDRLISNERPGDTKYKQEMERLMDSRELQDPEDVLQEILPILERTDAPLTMKDWISAARQRRHQYQKSHQNREEELNQIRFKKLLTQHLNSSGLQEIKTLLFSWRNLADSILLKRIVLNKSLFQTLNHICRYVLQLNRLPREIRLAIFAKFRSINQLTALATLSEEQITQRLEQLGYPAIRKLIWDCMEVVDLLERLPESISSNR